MSENEGHAKIAGMYTVEIQFLKSESALLVIINVVLNNITLCRFCRIIILLSLLFKLVCYKTGYKLEVIKYGVTSPIIVSHYVEALY